VSGKPSFKLIVAALKNVKLKCCVVSSQEEQVRKTTQKDN
jgi:hypothetical protein